MHRFRDRVAIFVGDGSIVYLTPRQAAELAATLATCADDCLPVKFEDSQFVTVTHELDDWPN